MKLFCLPCAGGSSYTLYKEWVRDLQTIQVVPIELPGRGGRFNEQLLLTVEDLTNDAEQAIKSCLEPGERFAIFGHSMGSLLTYELGLKFRNSPYKLEHIFISAFKPPHIEREELCHKFPDERLVKYIIDLGGTPEGFFDDKDIRMMFLPSFRADFTAIETYFATYPPQKLSVAMTVIAGRGDKISYEEMQEWQLYSAYPIEIHVLNGGHFYLKEQKESLHMILSESLKKRIFY